MLSIESRKKKGPVDAQLINTANKTGIYLSRSRITDSPLLLKSSVITDDDSTPVLQLKWGKKIAHTLKSVSVTPICTFSL